MDIEIDMEWIYTSSFVAVVNCLFHGCQSPYQQCWGLILCEGSMTLSTGRCQQGAYYQAEQGDETPGGSSRTNVQQSFGRLVARSHRQ